MKIEYRKSGTIGINAVFCILLLFVAVSLFGTIRSTSVDRISGTNLLLQIRGDIQAYRLAELESLLSSETQAKEKNAGQMESVLQQLEQKMRAIGPMLVTNEENAAWAAFRADWTIYAKKSKAAPPLHTENSGLQAITDRDRKLYELYERVGHSLEMLIDAHAKAPDSWSAFIKIFFKENRLFLAFLYICGASALLLVALSFYFKVGSSCQSTES